ncbi:MAG: flagellar hook-associated protein FlgK [candidate division Zixibacteria bacterium]|nr:flagellar hook-associated protein FlgK [candidate division Zixibacteria bacterium]MDH3938629.1 flagellar hook-associated protein FlgK [candidate division Zixibacteria bacterium]
MPGLFQGLELGKRALLTHQLSLQTTGHNIANVNTPGYRRQRVGVKTTIPELQTYGSIGTGIKATDVRHIRDLFLGNQFRQNSKSLGQWSYNSKTLSQVEALFNEPGDNTLGNLITEFWNGWSELSVTAGNINFRENVLSDANKLVNGLHDMARQLTDLQDSVDRDMVNLTADVNRLSTEIARLNHEIERSELDGVVANDLRDSRDLLIDNLSVIVDVNTSQNEDGDMIVYIGAMALVDGDKALSIGTETVNENGSVKHNLVWEGTKISFKNLNGQIKGLLDSRDKIIPDYLSRLDDIAKTLVDEVNALHTTGYGLNNYTGYEFFDSRFTTAATIQINQEVATDPEKIAAATQMDSQSDNTMALAIFDLSDQLLMKDNSMTINDFYNSLVGTLGVETHEAGSFTDNYEILGQQIHNARQSVEGVSLDEEMANMIKFQHAYDAAARVITTVDQALDTVINRMGIVGR